MPLVSVIMPVLNEEEVLGQALAAVRLQDFPAEIVVVDGGSSDRSREIALKSQAIVLQSPVSHRATQLNLGAKEASGDFFLFLHADTMLRNGALRSMERGIADDRVVGGGFARKFASDSIFLKMSCLLAEIRNRTVGWHLGDQALFCRRETFSVLGGFRMLHPFEDLDFSRRMAGKGRIITLRPPVVTSARRFEKEGPARRTWEDLKLTIRYIREQRKGRSTQAIPVNR